MNLKLSSQEYSELKSRHKKERDNRVCDRIKAILMRNDGYGYSEIAKILLLDDATVRQHIQDYKHTKKLKPENGGSESRLSAAEAMMLQAHLEEKTYLYVKDICAYVKQTFNKSYRVSGMTNWLHVHDFRYKKPHGVPAKADKAEQEKHIAATAQLKVEAASKGEPIYAGDSVHPHHQTRLVCGWIRKGKRKGIPMTACQRHINMMGAICLNQNHQFAYEQADKINAVSIQSFLKRLRKKHPREIRIHLILDNAGYHRSKEVVACALKLNIKIHYLPPYSPNLNPIERLWKLMHELVTYNQYYKSFSDFTEAILNFFKTIGRKKIILRKRITDKFHLLDSYLFAS